jgi:hypothetical protein
LMVFVGRIFGRWWGLKSRAFRNGKSAFMNGTTPGSFVPSTLWGWSEKIPSINQEADLHCTRNLPMHWSWTSQSLKLWEMFVAYKPPSLYYFVMVAQIDWDPESP